MPDTKSGELGIAAEAMGPPIWAAIFVNCSCNGVQNMNHLLRKMWRDDDGQDIAEYAVMLAVILVLVVGTIRLVGSNANNVFSSAASTLQ